MPKKGPYKLPFVPSKEWTENYLHLMRWGWYCGPTEPRLYKPHTGQMAIAKLPEKK